jgi:hypothetical protein
METSPTRLVMKNEALVAPDRSPHVDESLLKIMRTIQFNLSYRSGQRMSFNSPAEVVAIAAVASSGRPISLIASSKDVSFTAVKSAIKLFDKAASHFTDIQFQDDQQALSSQEKRILTIQRRLEQLPFLFANNPLRKMLHRLPHLEFFMYQLAEGKSVRQILTEAGISGFSEQATNQWSCFITNLFAFGRLSQTRTFHIVLSSLVLSRFHREGTDWSNKDATKKVLESIQQVILIDPAETDAPAYIRHLKYLFWILAASDVEEIRNTPYLAKSPQTIAHLLPYPLSHNLDPYSMDVLSYYGSFLEKDCIPPPISKFAELASNGFSATEIFSQIKGPGNIFSTKSQQIFVSAGRRFLENILLDKTHRTLTIVKNCLTLSYSKMLKDFITACVDYLSSIYQ